METKTHRYRIEWLHNGQWRMEWGHLGTFDTYDDADKARRSKDYDNVKTRIVMIKGK